MYGLRRFRNRCAKSGEMSNICEVGKLELEVGGGCVQKVTSGFMFLSDKTTRAHVELAFQFVLIRFSCSVDLSIPLFVM